MRQCPLKYKECPLKRPLSGRVVRLVDIQVGKATNGQKNGSVEESIHTPPGLSSWIVSISRLSLCEFTPDCLSNQWSLGTRGTKLVAREEKCLSGRIWYCSRCRGVEKLSGETQKCHRVGFHRVCYRGVSFGLRKFMIWCQDSLGSVSKLTELQTFSQLTCVSTPSSSLTCFCN